MTACLRILVDSERDTQGMGGELGCGLLKTVPTLCASFENDGIATCSDINYGGLMPAHVHIFLVDDIPGITFEKPPSSEK